MSDRAVRVISLLPAATEIVASLGMLDALLGVSHECDYPEEVNRKPRVTHCEIHGAGLPSAEVDRWVRETLRATGTLYTMDEDLVRRLRPDAILTQRLCDVCAVNYGSVARFAATLADPPRVVSLEPSSLADILRDIHTVGEVLGVPERAEAVVASLIARIEAVREGAAGAPRRRCVLLEWIRSALLYRPLGTGARRDRRRRRAHRASRGGLRGYTVGRRGGSGARGARPRLLWVLDRAHPRRPSDPAVVSRLRWASRRATRRGLRGGRLGLLQSSRSADRGQPRDPRRDPASGALQRPVSRPRRRTRRVTGRARWRARQAGYKYSRSTGLSGPASG